MQALAQPAFATTARMVDLASVRAMWRAHRPDAAVLAVTAAATLALDLVTAVLIGLAVAIVAALRAYARHASIEELPLDTRDHADEERTLLHRHVIAYRFDGPLFFAASHAALVDPAARGDVRVVIFRMSHLTTLDTTGAALLGETIRSLEGDGIVVLLSGLRPEHARLLDALGVLEHLRDARHVFDQTPDAIEHALSHLQREPPRAATSPRPARVA